MNTINIINQITRFMQIVNEARIRNRELGGSVNTGKISGNKQNNSLYLNKITRYNNDYNIQNRIINKTNELNTHNIESKKNNYLGMNFDAYA